MLLVDNKEVLPALTVLGRLSHGRACDDDVSLKDCQVDECDCGKEVVESAKEDVTRPFNVTLAIQEAVGVRFGSSQKSTSSRLARRL